MTSEMWTWAFVGYLSGFGLLYLSFRLRRRGS